MRARRAFFAIAAGLAAMMALVGPAAADTFTWAQSSGFVNPGPDASGTLRAGQVPGFFSNIPIAGNGGLEFFDSGAAPTPPTDTYRVISWGCPLDGDTDNPPVIDGVTAQCRNGGVLANAVVLVDPTPGDGDTGRSALRLTTFDSNGPDGLLDSLTGNKVTIAQLDHLNRVIDGEANALKAITIHSNLTIGTTPGPTVDPNDITLTFSETDNTSACPPPNPLGSACDDVFTFAGDFSNVPFVSSGKNFFLQFELSPTDACNNLVNTIGSIQIFDCGDHNIAIDFANGIAWAPEGHDSSIVIKMFVTEQPIGGDGCTPGYWKQRHHFGSYTAPYSPNQTMAIAFPELVDELTDAEENRTLVQTLSQGGGGRTALLRHFVAAVLNAANPNVNSQYENIQQIIDAVEAVLNGQQATLGGQAFNSIESLKDALEDANEGGCPLGRNEG